MLLPESGGALQAAGVVTGATAVAIEPMVPVLGVPLAVLLAACAGALIGLGYARPKSSDMPSHSAMAQSFASAMRAFKLLVTLVFIAVLSAWAVAIAPHVPGFGWTKEIPPLPAAGMLAAGGQFLFPKVLAAAGAWLDRKGGGT